MIKKVLKRHFWPLIIFYRFVLPKSSYLHSTGWVESIKRGYPCKDSGDEAPWMNYAVINILSERLNKGLHLFEFGSGYSTLFYAKLVKSVTSIEYDRKWFDLMLEKAPDNVTLEYKDKDVDGGYCRAINGPGREYDVVIVDGRDRVNCVKQSIEKLSPVGVVILDDSSREKYCGAVEHATAKWFSALNIDGLKPTGYGIHRTTILYRENNCLGI